MLSVVPLRPDQLVELFDPDGTLRSVRTVSKVFEGRKTAKDSLFRNWLRAAFVAKGLDNNADSTSQLQIESEFPATFMAEQSATFYNDLAIGFDEENHTSGTAIADGILNVLHPSFIPPPEPEVINVDNDRNVRQRAAPDTTNDALLQGILQLEENLADQRRREEQLRATHQVTSTAAPAQLRPSLRNPTTGPPTTGRATFDLPFDRVVSEYERRAEDAIEQYENISTTRTLTPQDHTHLQTLHQQFPQAGTAITRATFRASDRAMSLANRAMTLQRATATDRPSHPHPNGQSFMGDGFSSGSTSQFDLPPPPPGREFSSTTNQFGDTAFGTSGLTGPLGSNVFDIELPAPAQAPATMNIAQRFHKLQGKAIAGHLTTEEMNAFNVLKSGMSGSGLASDPSSSPTDTLGTRGFNLCGWAHLHPAEITHLHQCNDSGWLCFTKAQNKEERKAVIDTYFVQPLVRKNGRFRQILTTKFRDLIINWRLAPKTLKAANPTEA
jgi:hypothetical protein